MTDNLAQYLDTIELSAKVTQDSNPVDTRGDIYTMGVLDSSASLTEVISKLNEVIIYVNKNLGGKQDG